MSKINKKELDEYLVDSFDEVDADKKAFIILLRGKRVSVSSGKKIWASSGAARNALNNHTRNVSNYGPMYNLDGDDNRWDYAEEAEEAIKEWINQNIRIMSIGEYETSQAKLKKI